MAQPDSTDPPRTGGAAGQGRGEQVAGAGRGPWGAALLFGLCAALLQILAGYGGDPLWDGLMTASVLAQLRDVPIGDVLFFAHPLVIPLTAPFAWLVRDPLWAASVREAVCSGGVLALTYALTHAVALRLPVPTAPPVSDAMATGAGADAAAVSPEQRGRATASALCAALVVALAVGRWQLMLAGEEKEIAQLAGLLFLALYLDHRGLVDLGLGRMRPRQSRTRRVALGGILALSWAIHLTNGLLVAWLICDALLGRDRRGAGREAAWVLGVATLLAGPFFLWLALGPGGAHGVGGVVRYFLEYHLSGEFVPSSGTVAARVSEIYGGAHAWLWGRPGEGGGAAGGPSMSSVVIGFACVLLPCVAAMRRASAAIGRLLLWVGWVVAHFAFFEPAQPEAWAPLAPALATVWSLGLVASAPRWPSLGAALRGAMAVALLLVLGGKSVQARHDGYRAAQGVAQGVSARTADRVLMRPLVRWVDGRLPTDAVLIVGDRLLASYFHVYTARRPVVVDYLDMSPDQLRQRLHLTRLSIHFYGTDWTRARLRAAAAAGRPIFVLAGPGMATDWLPADPMPTGAQPLPWGELWLAPWQPPPSPKPVVPPVAPPSGPVLSAQARLAADDLTLRAVQVINPSVLRLSLTHAGESFSAKWKAMAPGGGEQQEGFDGNNSPRCEVAAARLDAWMAEGDAARALVPPVIVRAFHRAVPCDRACRGVPSIISADVPPTFPTINDHLVIGALSQWLDGAQRPPRFHGGLWNPARFAADGAYRRSFADLVTFLYLVGHGDADYDANFLMDADPPGRLYSIDNGRALDGVSYYTGQGDPDWLPFAQLAPGRLVAPALSRQTLQRLSRLTAADLRALLLLVAAIDLDSGHAVIDPQHEGALVALRDRPLQDVAGLIRRSRGTYTGRLSANGPTWLLLGISAAGVRDVLNRRDALQAQATTGRLPLFD